MSLTQIQLGTEKMASTTNIHYETNFVSLRLFDVGQDGWLS